MHHTLKHNIQPLKVKNATQYTSVTYRKCLTQMNSCIAKKHELFTVIRGLAMPMDLFASDKLIDLEWLHQCHQNDNHPWTLRKELHLLNLDEQHIVI